MNIKNLKIDLQKMASKKKALVLQRFFKTGKGEYGDGDIFIGVMLADVRVIVKKYYDLPLQHIKVLLQSRIHEERQTALLILVSQFENGADKDQAKIFKFYIANTKYINNWDLVDLSAHKIIGEYLFTSDRKILYKLAKSKNLWERRISVLSTFYFIKNYDFKDLLKISEILLKEKHDLIHKAVGWMLREVGKKDVKTLDRFLKRHYKKMPRTMLRYAIERFPEVKRKKYLKGLI